MTHFLMSEKRPEGHRLEDLLGTLRRELVLRMGKIVDDERNEARKVLENDVEILKHLSAAIALAKDNTRLLDRAFGPSKPGDPRIGSP